MKIGILGGTFDPPHIGHLNISLETVKRFQLNKVIWLVTKKNPLKKSNSVNDISNRMKLCNHFIKKNKLENISCTFLDIEHQIPLGIFQNEVEVLIENESFRE